MSEPLVAATVPRERREAAAQADADWGVGFCRLINAAVVAGEVCGNWLAGMLRGRRLELAKS